MNSSYQVSDTTRDANDVRHQIFCIDPVTGKLYPTAWFIGGSGATNLSQLLGGIAPAAQTYDFNTNADIVNVVTQAAGDASTKAASDAFVASAITNSQQAQVIAAHNYGVLADGKFLYDITTTSGSNAISCPNSDCNFTVADDGKICFATNGSRFGQTSQQTSTVILPQGTFTHTGTQTGTCSGGNASSSLTGTALFIWGHDDTTALGTAFTAAVNACATLQLPGVNPDSSGPAVMLVQAGLFNASSGSLGGCFQVVGGSRRGLGVRGVDINSTFIIPTPNFNLTSSATSALAAGSFFFAVADGINISDLSIFGAGNSNPGAGQTAKAIVAVLPNNNAAVHHLSVMGWGSNGTNGIGFGFVFGGNAFAGDYINVDGAGQTACQFQPVPSASANVVSVYGLSCWDTSKECLWVNGLSITRPQPLNSIGGNFGGCGGSGGGMIGITGGGIFNSFGDVIGNHTNSGNGITVGNAQGGTQTGAGFANIVGDSIDVQTAAGGSQIVTLSNSGNYATVSQTRFNGNSARSMLTPFVAGSYIQDVGGNSFTDAGVLNVTGSGAFFGSASIAKSPLVVGNVATTSGWGTTPSVSAASGNSVDGNFTITVGTTPGANPVATLTFPSAFILAPTCVAQQIGGTQTSAFVLSGAVSTTTAAFTWVGTPTGANTIQFHYHCWN